MSRPPCCRRVEGGPIASVFKPSGIPTRDLTTIAMTLDEFEAIRLADLEGLYQEEAAARMNVSRPTFGRIIGSARHKVAQALVGAMALIIEGGSVHAAPGQQESLSPAADMWPCRGRPKRRRCCTE